MSDLKITVPDMGDFKDVEIIEVLVKEGETINKNDSLILLKVTNLVLKFHLLNQELLTK